MKLFLLRLRLWWLNFDIAAAEQARDALPGLQAERGRLQRQIWRTTGFRVQR